VSEQSFAGAIAVRDAKLAEIAALSAKDRNRVAAVVGGVNLSTGQIAVGLKKTGENYGKCAEDLCADALGGPSEDILMSPAVRPRTMEVIPVCKRCQTKFSRNQFPPETPFEE